MVESQPSTPVAHDPAILIEHARKDYGKAAGGRREAVSDVSLAVSRGAIHGLLGPNGAGKTTTLKMLLGLVRPSGGRFEILGVPASKPGAKAQLGFLPEQPYFPPQLTAWEALRLYGQLSGLSDEADRGRGRATARARGARRQAEDAAVAVLPRHAPAPRTRAGAARLARGDRARRAGQRARPGRPARRPKPHARTARRGHEHPALVAPALRGRGGV